MKKHDKYVKSDMTSRERKEMRRKEEAKARGEIIMTESEYAVKSKNAKIFATIGIVVAVILIAIGVTIPCVMTANYMFDSTPIAVFTFRTGEKTYKVEYRIFSEECPNAANNFMYLASIGFFDGTVVFDTQNSQVRFGGYTDPTYDEESGEWSYSHRSDDLSFTSGLKDDFDPKRYEDEEDPDVFKYQIRSDGTSMNYTDADLYLCANTSGSALSATEFQFCVDHTADANHLVPAPGSSGSVRTLNLEVFGAPLKEDEARETFDEILALPMYTSESGEDEFARKYFRAPEQTVTLSSVKIYNYDAAWRDSAYEYGFESYMDEEGAFSTTGTWSKSYL